MADGFTIGARGLSDARRQMRDRAARMRDLAPPMKYVAQEIERMTIESFREQRSPHGEKWPKLAPSTIKARAAKLPGARRRGKGGKLTKGAKAKRATAMAAYAAGKGGVLTPLIDTGRMRGSVNAVVRGNEIRFSAVGYMGPHITGSIDPPNQPPKRNPTVFQRGQGGKFAPIPKVQSLLIKSIASYVKTGKVR